MNQTVRVELKIVADVTVTDEMKAGMIDQYPRSYNENSSVEHMAKGMLYASVNPSLTQDNSFGYDFWDGVGNMQGLIKNLELVED